MNFADRNEQAEFSIAPRIGHCTMQSPADARNIIAFPGSRASHRQPEPAAHRLRLRAAQALCKLKDTVLSLAFSRNQGAVQRKPGSGTTPAAHRPEYAQPATQAPGGGQARKRVCA
jgi:hypothetical protein